MADYVVYFIAAVDFDNKVKIGKTNNIKRRLSALQTGSAAILRVLHLIHLDTDAESSALEKRIHELIEYKKIHGEWFNLTLDEILIIYNKYVNDSSGKKYELDAALRWITTRPPNNEKCLWYWIIYAGVNEFNAMSLSNFTEFLIRNGYILIYNRMGTQCIMSAQPTGTKQDPIVISDEVDDLTAQINSLAL